MNTALRYSLHHDVLPAAAAAAVDAGLDAFNAAAAPLHEVRALGCFVHDDGGAVLGGAIGRTWGPACELQQLWVQPQHARQGLGSALLQRFEAAAAARGCTHIYLDTFSFQAPAFYRRHGYATLADNDAFPHGIVKHTLRKRL